MSYIGATPATTFTKVTSQVINGNGGATYTLDKPVNRAEELEVFIENVQQQPTVAYTASGTSLVFTANVPSATGNIYVIFRGLAQASTYDANAPRLIGDNTLTGDQTVTGDLTTTGDTSLKGNVVINEDSADKDFRVESDNRTHALFVDGAGGNVGINATPETAWHANFTTMDIGDQQSIGYYDGGGSHYAHNRYYDGAWKARETGAGGLTIQSSNGDTVIYSSASVSADASATMTETMRIASGGNVTKPLHPCFMANYDNNSYCWSDTADGGEHKQTFQNAPINVGNHYNTTDKRFVAPVAGSYYFYAQFFTNYTSDYARISAHLYKNGSDVLQCYNVVWETVGSVAVSGILTLASSDYVELYTALYDSNGTSNAYSIYCGSEYTYLCGYLIG